MLTQKRETSAIQSTHTPAVCRVMVVDDSAVIRAVLRRTLEADPEIRVVASVPDGQIAVDTIRRTSVDVVVLDVEMPKMDGLTALPLLIKASPNSKIIMASTLTRRNADISLRAMEAGAVDYIPKPSSGKEIDSGETFKRDLLGKVKAWWGAGKRNRDLIKPLGAPVVPRPTAKPASAPSDAKMRKVPVGFRPKIIAIGSSTGGPQALFNVLAHIAGKVQLPIVITQHMPATFTAILAEHIGRKCGLTAIEGVDGEKLRPGQCYIAPGGKHMLIEGPAGEAVIRLNEEPPENFCRPAVDPMFRSIASIFGSSALSVILTGMGQDGMLGARSVVQQGGVLVAQDEATSVVWGMPGAVANDGTCSAILPVKEIGPFICSLAAQR